MILKHSAGRRNSGLEGQDRCTRKHGKKKGTRSDLGQLWGVEAGGKEKVCCIHSNSRLSLYRETNKGNICLQTPNAATLCVLKFSAACVCILVFLCACAHKCLSLCGSVSV